MGIYVGTEKVTEEVVGGCVVRGWDAVVPGGFCP